MSTSTTPAPAIAADTPPPAPPPGGGRHGLGTLALISGLGLFLELLLIRWVTTEVRIFAYLQNTVLVVCFLGLGMGCWDSRRAFRLRDMLVPMVALLGLFALPVTRDRLAQVTAWLSVFRDLTVWATGGDVPPNFGGYPAAAAGLAMTAVLLVLIWATFVPVGRLLGRLMDDSPHPLRAYSVNVAASLAGIWLFVGLAAISLPPVVWVGVAAVLCLPLLAGRPADWPLNLVLLAAGVVLAWAAGAEPGAAAVVWSPYQKLVVGRVDPDSPHAEDIGVVWVNVNNTSYQEILDLRPETVAARPDRFPPDRRGLSQYDLPAKLHPAAGSAVVVGAGSGNDVAGLLRNGVSRVTAVEIDPVIIGVGRKYHPERPYQHPGVTVVNDDARSFFATTPERFDLAVFGLLDSHTTVAMSNARLDHYVYTRESVRRAKELLNPGGVMVLSFYVERGFIADRMAAAVREVFGHDPLVFAVPPTAYGRGGVLFVAGDPAGVAGRVQADPRLAALVAAGRVDGLTGTTCLATDDWPYVYLERPTVPVLYYVMAGVTVGLFLVFRRLLGLTGGLGAGGLHFFLLGAAFMLLEVQNVSKAAVVLGNTWEVNAVIISGVLVMILAANALAGAAGRLPAWPVDLALIGTCLGLYLFDLSTLAFLPYPAKAAAVGLLTSLPMLFSGLVFARSFAAAGRKDLALGANLFGGLFGSLLQSLTFVTGIKALLLVVAGLYLLAVLTRPRAVR